MFIKSIALSVLFLAVAVPTQAEVYKTIDENGRIHFSDRPIKSKATLESYQSSGYSTSKPKAKAVNNKALEDAAKQLKAERLQRQSQRKQEHKKLLKKRKQQKKIMAAAESKKKACGLAKKKEDLAFRKRSQAKNLKQSESAFSRYEKARDARIEKCR